MIPTLRRIGFKVMAATIAMAVALPATDLAAQHRPGRDDNARQERKHDNNRRPGNNHGNNGNRPGNNGNRPGNSHGNNGNRPGNSHGNNGNRPGNSHGNNGNRPGNSHGNNGNRPGNSHGNNGNRPGNSHGNNYHPGTNHGPGGMMPPAPSRPNPPGHNQGWRPAPPPHRPGRPPIVAWRPPTPPPAWRPGGRGPSFSTLLGVALGTALSNTVNSLIAAGYAVDGYQNNTVYLRGINQYNYFWPDATLRYSTAGALVGSEYLYTAPVYDLSRYNGLYNQMYSLYGIPAISSSPGSGTLSATWFGPGNCYITVQYQPVIINGIQNFCTSLSQGIY